MAVFYRTQRLTVRVTQNTKKERADAVWKEDVKTGDGIGECNLMPFKNLCESLVSLPVICVLQIESKSVA